MSIKSSSLITDDLHARRHEAAERQDRPRQKADQGVGSDGAHARDGLVAPPGLLTRHARTQPSSLPIDRQNSMAINQHYWMATGTTLAVSVVLAVLPSVVVALTVNRCEPVLRNEVTRKFPSLP
jgi:hypothetical protein